jgi:nifR3 family TIM-barrel protein
MIDPKRILCGGGKKRKSILLTSPGDRPLGYQLYGTDAILMADAAQLLANQGATLIDINMGCPQKKISRRGSGAGLLRTPAAAIKLAGHVVNSVSIPVTAKLRSGWETEGVATDMVSALEDAGIAAITIHGRTCLQKYSGAANWNSIRQAVNKARSIPVIGNGDITTPALAQAMIAETGCAGIMVGRAALKYPWTIREIHAALAGRQAPYPTRREHLDFMRQHFEAMAAQHGETIGTLLFRRWIPQYARGLNLGKIIMIALLQIRDADEFRRRLQELIEQA